jgi:hypothetical protein
MRVISLLRTIITGRNKPLNVVRAGRGVSWNPVLDVGWQRYNPACNELYYEWPRVYRLLVWWRVI